MPWPPATSSAFHPRGPEPMPSNYQLLLDGEPADPDLCAAVSSLEVEENMDLPGAVQLTLPVGRSADSDLTYASDPRFRPLANLAVVVAPAAESGGGLAAAASALLGPGLAGAGTGPQCIFDGHVL